MQCRRRKSGLYPPSSGIRIVLLEVYETSHNRQQRLSHVRLTISDDDSDTAAA